MKLVTRYFLITWSTISEESLRIDLTLQIALGFSERSRWRRRISRLSRLNKRCFPASLHEPRSSGQTRGGRYSWARYYHPGLQRFISEDPIGFTGGDVNLYAYVQNAPVGYRDPLGLELVGMTIGGTFFGGWGATRPATANVAVTGNYLVGLSRSGGCLGHGAAVGWGAGSWNELTRQGGSVYGLAVAKLGPGIFYSNAESFGQLQGPSTTTIIAAGPINIQTDQSTDPTTGKITYVTSVGLGVGLGVARISSVTPRTKDVATYPCDSPVTTLNAGSPVLTPAGFSLSGRK